MYQRDLAQRSASAASETPAAWATFLYSAPAASERGVW
jgi:hypothetical protein